MSGVADLLVHLKPCPVDVDFAGRTYTIPAKDALAWVDLVIQADIWKIFPNLAGQRAVDDCTEALWNGEVSPDDVTRVGLEVISAIADRPWWEVMRIVQVATDAWEVVHVNDAAGKAFAGWLDQVWSNILAHVDPKKRAGFLGQIEAVPKGWETDTDFDAEEKAFMSAMKAVMK